MAKRRASSVSSTITQPRAIACRVCIVEVLHSLKLDQAPILGKWSFTVLLRGSWTMASLLVCKTYDHFVDLADPRVDRGSHERATGKSALHSISAWVCGLKMCLGLKSVDDKSNEPCFGVSNSSLRRHTWSHAVPNSSSRFMQAPELIQEVFPDQTESRSTRSSHVWLAGQEQLRQKNTTVFVPNFLTCYSHLFQSVATRIETPVRDLYASVAAIRHNGVRSMESIYHGILGNGTNAC